jgi:FkbM family methyltransferase
MAKIDRKTLLENGPILMKKCRYGYMMFNRLDEYIGQSLEQYGEYNGAEGDFLCGLLSPGQTVVEVGANIGTHTTALAKAVGETGKVIAFEPQPGVFQLLCANIAVNNYAQVATMPVAAGAKPRRSRMPRVDYSKPGNFGAVALNNADDAGDIVTVGRFDDMLQIKSCRLLKVDAGGMELDPLQGGEELIKRHKPILYVENDRKEKSAALISFIMALGYAPYWHMPLLFRKNNFFENENYIFKRERIASINMVCAPPEMKVANMEKLKIDSPDDSWRDRFK